MLNFKLTLTYIFNNTLAIYIFITLGASYAKKHGLTPSKNVHDFDESRAMDPTIFNEFSTGALRFGHSQINNPVPCLNEDWQEMEEKEHTLQVVLVTYHLFC